MNVRSIARGTLGTVATLGSLAAIVYTAPATPVQASVSWHAPRGHSITPRWLSWSAAFRDYGARCVYVKAGRGPRVGEVCRNGKAYAYTAYAPVPFTSPASLPRWVTVQPAGRQIVVWAGNGGTSLFMGPHNFTETS